MEARAATVCLALLLTTGCAEDSSADGSAAGVADSVYAEVMARLALLDSTMTPPSSHPRTDLPYDSLRAGILRKWGVSGDALLEYARQRGTRPDRMQEVWERIRALRDSLLAAGWSPARTGEDTAGAAGDTTAPVPDSTAGPRRRGPSPREGR